MLHAAIKNATTLQQVRISLTVSVIEEGSEEALRFAFTYCVALYIGVQCSPFAVVILSVSRIPVIFVSSNSAGGSATSIAAACFALEGLVNATRTRRAGPASREAANWHVVQGRTGL